jgi:hypothetical protein
MLVTRDAATAFLRTAIPLTTVSLKISALQPSKRVIPYLGLVLFILLAYELVRSCCRQRRLGRKA